MSRKWHVGIVIVLILVFFVACDKDKEDGKAMEPGTEGTTQQERHPAQQEQEKFQKTTISLYYPDKELMSLYRVEVDIEFEKEADLPIKALEYWIRGTDHADLARLVPENVEVQSFKAQGDIAHVSFSKQLQQANLGGGGEQFLMESIALIMNQFGYKATQVLIDGNRVESILGHVSADVPFESPDPKEIPNP